MLRCAGTTGRERARRRRARAGRPGVGSARALPLPVLPGPAAGGTRGADYICSGQPVSMGRSGFAVMARFAQWWYEYPPGLL